MKRISEVTDTRAIVVMRKGEVVAKVHARWGRGGSVQVDVVQRGDAAKNTAKALNVALDSYGCAPESVTLQQSRAGGYGYDKFTAALSGLVIDGHRLTNHCGTDAKVKALFVAYCKALDTGKGPQESEYWEKRARKIGARFNNWLGTKQGAIDMLVKRYGRTPEDAAEECNHDRFAPRVARYSSLYRDEGLRYLSAIGYTIIEAI